MEPLTITIRPQHFRASHGYIFDDCPLKIAVKDKFPDAFVVIGGRTATIIYNPKTDKDAFIYEVSGNYNPSIDHSISKAKEGSEEILEVKLTLLNNQENLFLNEVKEDHVVERIPQLPDNLFAN